MQDFLIRIETCLRKKNQRRPWLSTMTGISLSTINTWFAEDRIPGKLEQITAVADALGVSLDYLVRGKENKTIENFRFKKILEVMEFLDDAALGELETFAGYLASKPKGRSQGRAGGSA